MPKNIQLRNVPDDLHRRLKARAALAGQSLSEYLITQVEGLVARPTPQELQERLSRREPVSPSRRAAEVLREERDSG
ncbi:hypothetical protein G3480_08840 [Thiorhodococcus mannitoliphagus]|uniref:Antitoxin FitA-like ribbon-helix-helix domain-containing protein n=1 Tax=Thiorhodococcus mannitoliphagus TaxID=329406 RepID=A0A6P1DT83_9GAMM|nr:hypothetical protein [Thiorhodococcus mannitoliphagus]NEX20413.1 hypothetical protein [Thiorhodococcus mannitoliphagus]